MSILYEITNHNPESVEKAYRELDEACLDYAALHLSSPIEEKDWAGANLVYLAMLDDRLLTLVDKGITIATDYQSKAHSSDEELCWLGPVKESFGRIAKEYDDPRLALPKNRLFHTDEAEQRRLFKRARAL